MVDVFYFQDLVADASCHLVDIIGRHDMSSASLYLALFQVGEDSVFKLNMRK